MKTWSICWTLGLLALLLYSCAPDATDGAVAEADQAELLIVPGERVGRITLRQASPSDVLAAYPDHARADSIHLGEGMMAPGVVVFPEDPRKMLEIYWDGELDPLRPAFVRIIGHGLSDGGSAWKTAEGITIGTSLEEVERLNGKPFSLYGFGWDAEGLVADWHGGALSTHLHLRFQMTEQADVPSSVWGDVVLRSDDPQVRRLLPAVAVIELSFPRSEPLSLIQGRWRAEADATYEVEITADRIRHFFEGEFLLENELTLEPNCGKAACADGEASLPAWCLLEKGEFDIQCMMLLSCTGQRLVYTLLGSTGEAHAFTKVE
jgi:hypothetical protein